MGQDSGLAVYPRQEEEAMQIVIDYERDGRIRVTTPHDMNQIEALGIFRYLSRQADYDAIERMVRARAEQNKPEPKKPKRRKP
jgi:hypothetical protein